MQFYRAQILFLLSDSQKDLLPQMTKKHKTKEKPSVLVASAKKQKTAGHSTFCLFLLIEPHYLVTLVSFSKPIIPIPLAEPILKRFNHFWLQAFLLKVVNLNLLSFSSGRGLEMKDLRGLESPEGKDAAVNRRD